MYWATHRSVIPWGRQDKWGRQIQNSNDKRRTAGLPESSGNGGSGNDRIRDRASTSSAYFLSYWKNNLFNSLINIIMDIIYDVFGKFTLQAVFPLDTKTLKNILKFRSQVFQGTFSTFFNYFPKPFLFPANPF